jgi:hypothetical protein
VYFQVVICFGYFVIWSFAASVYQYFDYFAVSQRYQFIPSRLVCVHVHVHVPTVDIEIMSTSTLRYWDFSKDFIDRSYYTVYLLLLFFGCNINAS